MTLAEGEQLIKELDGYESTDEIVVKTLSQVTEKLNRTKAADFLQGVDLCLYSPETASQALLQSERYATKNCVALYAERMIVVNEEFIRELEAAIRAFNLTESLLSSPWLRSDEDLFGLVRRIREDRRSYLNRLRCMRGRGPDLGDVEDSSVDQLAMFMTYLIAHETHHLMADEDPDEVRRNFDDLGGKQYDGEARIRNAIVKLMMHADEFARFEFTLPGFEGVTDIESKVRRVSEDMRSEIKVMAANYSKWLQDENNADAYAIDTMKEIIGRTSERDPAAADRDQYLFIRALFVAGLYGWYRDLFSFYGKLGISGMRSIEDFTLAMTQARSRYIDAAVLFGQIHRFMMLRSVVAISSLLEARSSFYQQPEGKRNIWFRGDTNSLEEDEGALQTWRESECLQREYLLRIVMDTAIKIANVGAATGWILDMDRKRGTPQLFQMSFEGIGHAMYRLKHGGKLRKEGN